ncbi:hypothetical protein SARC_07618 [Sphaeroforma arctica JP610]|uniref:Uncharacterized protein n=1 Tax=Sphaeroforma arctica JP610 TaxID=667725 RepID=A0A0L0FVN5_9EUKA|nr:hypothetical protein SARC_07618 [Sphaeroforma arctica JP610]KNC80003.1 hypothetical protein SARC_07618 [Sphaeroforma arctica JP610]|eukprot:XP_014153905.1 hypothetical protein SARC_07618 [Sphaeroforma arctica JP610]
MLSAPRDPRIRARVRASSINGVQYPKGVNMKMPQMSPKQATESQPTSDEHGSAPEQGLYTHIRDSPSFSEPDAGFFHTYGAQSRCVAAKAATVMTSDEAEFQCLAALHKPEKLRKWPVPYEGVLFPPSLPTMDGTLSPLMQFDAIQKYKPLLRAYASELEKQARRVYGAAFDVYAEAAPVPSATTAYITETYGMHKGPVQTHTAQEETLSTHTAIDAMAVRVKADTSATQVGTVDLQLSPRETHGGFNAQTANSHTRIAEVETKLGKAVPLNCRQSGTWLSEAEENTTSAQANSVQRYAGRSQGDSALSSNAVAGDAALGIEQDGSGPPPGRTGHTRRLKSQSNRTHRLSSANATGAVTQVKVEPGASSGPLFGPNTTPTALVPAQNGALVCAEDYTVIRGDTDYRTSLSGAHRTGCIMTIVAERGAASTSTLQAVATGEKREASTFNFDIRSKKRKRKKTGNRIDPLHPTPDPTPQIRQKFSKRREPAADYVDPSYVTPKPIVGPVGRRVTHGHTSPVKALTDTSGMQTRVAALAPPHAYAHAHTQERRYTGRQADMEVRREGEGEGGQGRGEPEGMDGVIADYGDSDTELADIPMPGEGRIQRLKFEYETNTTQTMETKHW